MPAPTPHFFATAQDFRRWLHAHHTTARELIVGYHKVGSGLPSMTWPQSVDEALCYGWIDGVRRKLSDTSYTVRFTPRRPNSIWSAVNLAKVQTLIAEGRMQPAGLAVYEARNPARSSAYSFEQTAPAKLDTTELAALQQHTTAWPYFQSLPTGYRRTVTHWISSAKKSETRARRFAQLLQACIDGRRLT